MASRKRRQEGPRRATRWIGEALVLDGDLATGAPAVWRPPKDEPRCARVRIEDVSRDWEFGADEAHLQVAAAQLVGPGIVPRFATYADDEVESVVVVEEDVAGVTLRALIDALAGAGGEAPAGLVAHVGRELMSALVTAGEVRLRLDPRAVDVGWDGRLALRPSCDPRGVDELDVDLAEDAGAVLYRDDVDEPASRLMVLGAVLYELVAGRHPYAIDGDAPGDEDGDDLDELLERIARRDFEPLAAHAPVERLLRGEIEGVDDAKAALDAVLAADPFSAADLAGMLRGLFPGRKEHDDVEREDRLQVLPGPRVEPETWTVLDADMLGRDTAGYETLDLDDVRRGTAGRDDWEPPYEPSVPPVDPFDDE